MERSILRLIPQILGQNYFFEIQYNGTNKSLSKLNHELIELDNDFISLYQYYFMKIMFSFQELKKKADNKFYGIDDSYSNLIFQLSLTFTENIIIEFQYELFQQTKYLKKEINYEKKLEVQKISNQDNKFINSLVNSFIGFNNLGGTCSISSIIQILIHTECFIKEFLSLSNHCKPISKLFFDLLEAIKCSNNIQDDKVQDCFYDFCYYLQEKMKLKVIKNDPMYFCSKILEKLEEENPGKIIHLFSGKKKIEFQNLNYYDSEEQFLFYIIQLDYQNSQIKNRLFKEQKIEIFDYSKKTVIQNIQNETLIEEPEILMLNIEIDQNSKYKFYFDIPKDLNLNHSKYKLYAINKYDDVHSRV